MNFFFFSMIFNDWLKTATQQVGVNNAKVEGKKKKVKIARNVAG